MLKRIIYIITNENCQNHKKITNYLIVKKCIKTFLLYQVLEILHKIFHK